MTKQRIALILGLMLTCALLVTPLGAFAQNMGVRTADIWDRLRVEQHSLIDVLREENDRTGEFDILIAAIEHIGIDGYMDIARRNFTLFAPTDAAFASLGITENTLSAIDTETLVNTLAYHVTRGALDAATVQRAQMIRMLNMQFVEPSVSNGSVYINDARVLRADIFADNGVIHVIDMVLEPESLSDREQIREQRKDELQQRRERLQAEAEQAREIAEQIRRAR